MYSCRGEVRAWVHGSGCPLQKSYSFVSLACAHRNLLVVYFLRTSGRCKRRLNVERDPRFTGRARWVKRSGPRSGSALFSLWSAVLDLLCLRFLVHIEVAVTSAVLGVASDK